MSDNIMVLGLTVVVTTLVVLTVVLMVASYSYRASKPAGDYIIDIAPRIELYVPCPLRNEIEV